MTSRLTSVPSGSACSSRPLCLNLRLPKCMTVAVTLYTLSLSSCVKPSTSKAVCWGQETTARGVRIRINNDNWIGLLNFSSQSKNIYNRCKIIFFTLYCNCIFFIKTRLYLPYVKQYMIAILMQWNDLFHAFMN